jgi:hypothetical protein
MVREICMRYTFGVFLPLENLVHVLQLLHALLGQHLLPFLGLLNPFQRILITSWIRITECRSFKLRIQLMSVLDLCYLILNVLCLASFGFLFTLFSVVALRLLLLVVCRGAIVRKRFKT